EPGRVRRLVAEVRTGDPRTAYLQLTDGLAGGGRDGAQRVHDAGRHPGRSAPLAVPVTPVVLAGRPGRGTGHRAERGRLGHPPGVHDLDAVPVAEGVDERGRAGRAADHDLLE